MSSGKLKRPIPFKKPGPRPPRIPPAPERVPVEVWEDIFDLATYVPTLMDLEPTDPFDQPSTLLPGDTWDPALLRASMRLRYALTRVCRIWNAAATPFLYRICRCNLGTDPLPEVQCTFFNVEHFWSAFPRHFLSVQGGQLTTAHIRLSLSNSQALVETAIVQLFDMLPNLTRLHLTLPHWRLEFPYAKLPPRVTHLSLRIRPVETPTYYYYGRKPRSDEEREDEQWDALFEGLFEAVHGIATAQLGHALEAVRFLDPDVCGAMRTGLHTDDLRMEMAEEVFGAGTPFRFEDCEGREMVPARSTEEGLEGVVVFA
ncbi:hypothetical protein OF83DRAFT_1088715 [Amylostereum chailletii]|nr:hypothetical protein OF83DRAFT_1088715 [Amylostereum chailletii]